MISAASSQVIFFAMAFKITSCTFIIRSSSAAEIARLVSKPKRLQSLFQKRTNTVLITPDIYRANDKRETARCKFLKTLIRFLSYSDKRTAWDKNELNFYVELSTCSC